MCGVCARAKKSHFDTVSQVSAPGTRVATKRRVWAGRRGTWVDTISTPSDPGNARWGMLAHPLRHICESVRFGRGDRYANSAEGMWKHPPPAARRRVRHPLSGRFTRPRLPARFVRFHAPPPVFRIESRFDPFRVQQSVVARLGHPRELVPTDSVDRVLAGQGLILCRRPDYQLMYLYPSRISL